MAVAELLSKGVAKKLVERPRPPKEWIPHDDVEERPDSSFPSGHTAAAVAFTAAVVPAWPCAGAACAVPAVLVAVSGSTAERTAPLTLPQVPAGWPL
ncbi:phosphatase PAP2 family protein [Streptomyces sp. NPDC058623]|uniref:phosphatase PAP2 family protein n=1 Tax=Streptomyces sp. NPDC058623 TaxID=3346563 RepID=UPI003657115C